MSFGAFAKRGLSGGTLSAPPNTDGGKWDESQHSLGDVGAREGPRARPARLPSRTSGWQHFLTPFLSLPHKPGTAERASSTLLVTEKTVARGCHLPEVTERERRGWDHSWAF